MPTGVAIRDVRQQLFDAAERVLLRDGPSALTSRAVTTEAGCAKGVLHRHFVDFDEFLVELIRDRTARVDAGRRPARCRGPRPSRQPHRGAHRPLQLGRGVVGLIIFRDDLRVRLRRPPDRHARWPRRPR